MAIRVDFTNVQGDFEPLENGTYNATIFNAEVKDSKDGKPYINWDLIVQDEPYVGRHQWFMTSLQTQALWKLKQMLLRLGVPAESLAGVFDLDLEPLFGKPCRVVIEQESYQGQMRSRVVDLLEGDAEVTDQPLFR
jgi:hypothetical protein